MRLYLVIDANRRWPPAFDGHVEADDDVGVVAGLPQGEDDPGATAGRPVADEACQLAYAAVCPAQRCPAVAVVGPGIGIPALLERAEPDVPAGEEEVRVLLAECLQQFPCPHQVALAELVDEREGTIEPLGARQPGLGANPSELLDELVVNRVLHGSRVSVSCQ